MDAFAENVQPEWATLSWLLKPWSCRPSFYAPDLQLARLWTAVDASGHQGRESVLVIKARKMFNLASSYLRGLLPRNFVQNPIM